MDALTAIKTFFGREDVIAPTGGRPMLNHEILVFAKGAPEGATRELALLCAEQLGVELDEPVRRSTPVAA